MMGGFRRYLGAFFETLAGSVMPPINREADILLEKFENRAVNLQERMLANLGFAAFMLGALVFLMIAGYYYFIERQGWTSSQSAALIGIALIVLGFIFRSAINQRRRNYG